MRSRSVGRIHTLGGDFTFVTESANTPDTIELPPHRILAIAKHERELMICILGVVVLIILNTGLLSLATHAIFQGESATAVADLLTNTLVLVGYAQLASLVATWVVTLALLSKVDERAPFLLGVLVAVLMLAPMLHIVLLPIPIAIIWAIDRAARLKLKAHGATLGLMGADLNTLNKRLAT